MGTLEATGGRLVFALAGSTALGESVAQQLGLALASHEERDFERGEHKARPLVSVRGCEVAVLAGVHGDPGGPSANDRLVRLWFFLATLKDAGARHVTAVVPYLPYSRKERRTKARDPIASRYVAQHFEAAGTDLLVTVEPHNLAAFENAFRIPTIPIALAPVLVARLAEPAGADITIVSPDVGGVKRAQLVREALARRLQRAVGLAFFEKRRSAGALQGGSLVGQVAGSRCVIVDDLVSSGSTLALAATACREAGAYTVDAAVAHALFTPDAQDRLASGRLDNIWVTDSVPLAHAPDRRLPLSVLALGPTIAAVLRGVWLGGSLSEATGIEP